MNFTLSDFKNDYIPEEDYIDKEDELAFAYTLNQAAGGNAEYQFIMGETYSNAGHGVKINLEKAEYWYLKSAEQGNGQAQCALGELYFNGKLNAPDLKKAAYWLEQSASQDNFRAADILAKLYYDGENIEKARLYAQKGAQGGYPSSFYYLALTHKDDKNDYEKYLLQAVNLNYGNAYPELFAFYLNENRREDAVKIYNLAIERGFSEIIGL